MLVTFENEKYVKYRSPTSQIDRQNIKVVIILNRHPTSVTNIDVADISASFTLNQFLPSFEFYRTFTFLQNFSLNYFFH